MQAVERFRSNLKPWKEWIQHYVAIGVPLSRATAEEAQFLASSVFQKVLGILTVERKELQPPAEEFWEALVDAERHGIADFLAKSVIGGPDTLAHSFADLKAMIRADEFILACDIYKPATLEGLRDFKACVCLISCVCTQESDVAVQHPIPVFVDSTSHQTGLRKKIPVQQM